MSRFMIPVSWTVDSVVTIQADSIEEAVNSIEDGPLPTEHTYRDNSFIVHEEDALIGIKAVHEYPKKCPQCRGYGHPRDNQELDCSMCEGQGVLQ